jgi:hypothetical protein
MRASAGVILGLTAVFCLVIVMRNDWWNWSKVEPLLFGFLPVGLWWQGCVSIMASILMALCVRFAWPGHLEGVETESGVSVARESLKKPSPQPSPAPGLGRGGKKS